MRAGSGRKERRKDGPTTMAVGRLELVMLVLRQGLEQVAVRCDFGDRERVRGGRPKRTCKAFKEIATDLCRRL